VGIILSACDDILDEGQRAMGEVGEGGCVLTSGYLSSDSASIHEIGVNLPVVSTYRNNYRMLCVLLDGKSEIGKLSRAI
jgi:hypothetical protein